MTTKRRKKYLVSDPDILGGIPVIKGTRVPISRIFLLIKDGYTLEAIHKDYHHIDRQTMSHALDEAIEIVISRLHYKNTT